MKCPKCNAARLPDDYECRNCGIIYSKIGVAQKKKQRMLNHKQNTPQKKPNKPTKQTQWTSDQRINEQLKKIGGFDSFFTRKEIKYLPKILRDDEIIQAVGSGTLLGNTWLIVPINQRLLFLDKGMIYGLKQTEMQYEKISAVSCKTGLLLASISLATSGGKKEIKNLQKNDAPYLAETISRQIRRRQ